MEKNIRATAFRLRAPAIDLPAEVVLRSVYAHTYYNLLYILLSCTIYLTANLP